MIASVAPELMSWLTCPGGHGPLTEDGAWLRCQADCSFPVVDGVPVLLRADLPLTIGLTAASLEQAHAFARAASSDALPPAIDPFDQPPWWVRSLGIDDDKRHKVLARVAEGEFASTNAVDPVISYLVAETNGIAYRQAVGCLNEVPIPNLRLPLGGGRTLLDVGCSWGRWVVAAARLGYRPIGLDPSLGAVMAARRLTRSLGIEAHFVVGDARVLPFRAGSLDTVFSYSVVQHLSFEDATQAVTEMGRVLASGGNALVQMPNRLGIRSLQHQVRRRFRPATGFEVRYWSLARLIELFRTAVGPTEWSVDCFFGLGLQATDLAYMGILARAATHTSEALRKVAKHLRPLGQVADSVYLNAHKR